MWHICGMLMSCSWFSSLCTQCVDTNGETSFFDSVSSGKFEAIPDDLTPEEILEQAQRAAQAAAERLTLKRPNTNVCG
jgi:hypothetical protein